MKRATFEKIIKMKRETMEKIEDEEVLQFAQETFYGKQLDIEEQDDVEQFLFESNEFFFEYTKKCNDPALMEGFIA